MKASSAYQETNLLLVVTLVSNTIHGTQEQTHRQVKFQSKPLETLSLDIIATGEPILCLRRRKKLQIYQTLLLLKDYTNISSQHTTAQILQLITLRSLLIIRSNAHNGTNHLHNNSTNWIQFKKHLESNINCYIPLKTPEQIKLEVINFTGI